MVTISVMLAKAGIACGSCARISPEIPAFAGTTSVEAGAVRA